MAEAASKLGMTMAEYLALEEESETKHEYLGGQVYDMAGGTPDHGLVALNVGAELRAQLRDRPCRVYNSDVRIRVQATDVSTYPDVSVVCGKIQLDMDDPGAIVNPVVLVEVLSKSTEGYDRGEKFAHYREIPSLREYVLVAYQKKRVEVYRRDEQGVWTFWEARGSGTIELTSIGCTLALDEVYRGAFEEEETAPAS